MKSSLIKLVRWTFQNIIGKNLSAKAIIFIHKASDVNLLKLGYNSVGILNYQNMDVSGEKNVLNNIIKPYFEKEKISPVIFDVGANTGGYFSILKQTYPNAEIFSFEPNPNSFKELLNQNANSFNLALGDKDGELSMYRPKSDLTSTHFSSNKNFVSYSNNIIEVKVKQSTLKQVVSDLSINKIDFLKIDTEGHDLFVLKGAGQSLLNQISFIQFEINESLLDHRFLLKDFYEALPDFNLYRLLPNGVMNLSEYSKYNEIFRYQNILAISKSIESKIST